MVPNDPLQPLVDGHTELSPSDREGLKLTYVTTRGELNEAEQANIVRAVAARRPPSLAELLDDLYLRRLHRDMFGDVWIWAGRYRRLETNLGVEPDQIASRIRNLVADVAAWAQHQSEDPDRIAARFHHRLVWIHAFPNGNGRHGRLACDYLCRGLGRRAFTWGRDQAVDAPTMRAAYLTALRAADHGSLDRLVEFGRS